MILKLHFEKASGRLDWKFISDILLILNIPPASKQLLRHASPPQIFL